MTHPAADREVHAPILTVAIQGDKGSFHEIAALRHYKQPIRLIYCATFADTFAALSSGAHRAFVAVENSDHGIIDEVASLLALQNVTADGEYLLPIQQHVIGLPGTKLDEVKEIVSHPVALSQSSEYVTNMGVKVTEYHDTAAAVELVKAQNNPFVVAIAGEQAASLHNMVILKRAVQNDPNNATLFRSFHLI